MFINIENLDRQKNEKKLAFNVVIENYKDMVISTQTDDSNLNIELLCQAEASFVTKRYHILQTIPSKWLAVNVSFFLPNPLFSFKAVTSRRSMDSLLYLKL